MDGLRTYCLALGLLCAGSGCLEHQTDEPKVIGLGPSNNPSKQEDLPKRQPKAATCVAFATFREQQAADPKIGGTERTHLHDEARVAYNQALRIDPNYLPAHIGLAKLYVTLGDNARAVQIYENALEGHPKEPQLWYELGMFYAREKQWDLAIKDLQTACELDPENRQCIDMIGFCLARAGRYEESVAAFRKVVGEGMAHYNVARMLHHIQQDDLCKQHLVLALQASPDLAEAQQLLAELDHTAGPSTNQ
jgi:tetratricopeptide (TPR) repeat protein